MEQPLSRWLAVDDTLGWGTTAESRRRQAPDPEGVVLDGRGDTEQIRFVRELAKVMLWPDPSGVGPSAAPPVTWEAFCHHPTLTPEAMAAVWGLENGAGRLSEAQLRWLSRPHFALLLVFIRLLRHQRQLLNGIPARHLRHYYQDRLGFTARPGESDRVTVAFTLEEDSPPLMLPAGRVLRAGVDDRGRERLYRTLTDLSLNHARVSRLRAIQLERGVTSLASIQARESIPSQRLDRMLRLAYGEEGRSSQELLTLLPALRFCSIDGRADHLQLEPHEFLRLMRLVRQRTDAGSVAEWEAINRWLGVEPLLKSGVLSDPRAFTRNVAASLLGPNGGVLDWKGDGLSAVNSIDDLYAYRDEEEVRPALRQLLTGPNCLLRHDLPTAQPGDGEALFQARLDTFVRLMTMKLHIDAQWQQVNWLLERCGKRRRQLPSWQLDPGNPNTCSPDFAANLAKAWGLSDPETIPWPAPLSGGPSIPAPAAIPLKGWRYFLDLEALEERHSLPVDELSRLCGLAELVGQGQARAESWARLQELLRTAYHERWAANRRAVLLRARGGKDDEEAFAQLLRQALRTLQGGSATATATATATASSSSVSAAAGAVGADGAPLSWPACLETLAPWLPQGGREALERFGASLREPGTAPRRLHWSEVAALLEGAQRAANGERPPELARVDWRQLRGRELEIKAEAMAAGDPLEPCFWTDQAGVSEPPAPPAGPGFGVASRLLALAEGRRRIALTFRFTADSGNPEALLASLLAPAGYSLKPDDCAGQPPLSPRQPGWGLNQALIVEMSTAEGWWVLPIAEASLEAQAGFGPAPWGLRLGLALAPSDPSLAPLAAGELPRLRLRLRPWREGTSGDGPWRSCGGFEGLRLASARLRVEVEGLQGVRLQQEGAAVDPREPFTPFGSSPVVGSCLYISHPELLHGDLEEIRFAGRWKNLPANLTTHYSAYRGWPGLAPDAAVTAQSFRMDVSLWVRDVGAVVEQKALPLFGESGPTGSPDSLAIRCPLTPGPVLAAAATAAESAEDLREQARVWRWRLTPLDFGHGLFPVLAARRAQELALAISGAAGRQALAMAEAMGGKQGSLRERYDEALKAAGATPINPADYAVPEAYTPLLEGLEVSYSRVQDLGAAAGAGQLLRVDLFGEEEPLELPPPARPGSEAAQGVAPLLLPSYPHPGELWLELEGIRPGLPIALAFQLAAGSARGARPTPAVLWEIRRGWQWLSLPVREDGTEGLLHSGILRFSLPEAAPPAASEGVAVPEGVEGAAPGTERLWLRASLLAPVEAYGRLLGIQSQAVEAEALPPEAEPPEDEDGEDAAAGSAGAAATGEARQTRQPLAPHSITDLEESMPGIAAIHQPFSSRLGRAAETEAELRMRAAERLRHKDRALAGWDYERLLWEAFASQLHTVVCQPAREGQPVEVVVIPDLRQQVPRNLFAPGAPADLLAAMERHLRQRCPDEGELVVRNATYVPVMARLWVCLREGVDRAFAERELREAAIRVLSPWCFDATAEVRLGGEVRASDLAAAIDALPFVAYLERLRLFLVDPGGKPLRIDGQDTSSEDILRAPAPDVVLIAAPIQAIEFVSATTSQPSLIGIGAMRIELDFQIA